MRYDPNAIGKFPTAFRDVIFSLVPPTLPDIAVKGKRHSRLFLNSVPFSTIAGLLVLLIRASSIKRKRIDAWQKEKVPHMLHPC